MQRGIERFTRPEDTEGDMHELAYHGADDDFWGLERRALTRDPHSVLLTATIAGM